MVVEKNITIGEVLKGYFSDTPQEEIAQKLNISQQAVSAYFNGKPFGKKAAQKWEDIFGINSAFLLTGEGEIIKRITIEKISDKKNACIIQKNSLPLIPIDAIAGFKTEDYMGVTPFDCEHYRIPEFSSKGVEFLIRVSGSSMYPKYSNGDILACKKIDQIVFFQWGKIYVIDSSQGALVKRIFEDKENPDNIICVSDNKEYYPPFTMPKNDIRGLSIVLGVIRME